MILTGRVPSRHDPRTIRMTSLSPLPAPPPQFKATEVADWPTLGNDTVPCCTCAAAAHMIHRWTAAHAAPVTISEDQVIATYVQVSGGGDGAEMLEVLRFWRKTGFAQRRLRAYVALDPHAVNDLRTTIYLFGAAYVGLSFPDFAVKEATDKSAVWDVPAGGAVGENAPKTENGHCVAVIGYDTEHVYVVSCGELRTMTWEFYRAYNDEAYALLSRDWYGDERRSPTGFDLIQYKLRSPLCSGRPGLLQAENARQDCVV